MSVKILTGFDGSCPHFQEGIKTESDNIFTIFPGYRSRDGMSEESKDWGGSRFYIRIKNSGHNNREIIIIADWETTQKCNNHDQGYLRRPQGNWEIISAIRIDASKIKYKIKVLPGVSDLALFPEYNYSDCVKYVRSLKKSGVDIDTVGRSKEGRAMWMIKLGSPDFNALNFFIQARDHAYETAGSYCVEGIVSFLLSGNSLAEYLRSKFSFYVVPMTNPDGVFNGMSRLTWEKGADMNRVYCADKDEAHATLLKTINKIKPKVHMNIHNWTYKFVDGLLANDEEIADKILHCFPDDFENYKHWQVETNKSYLKTIKLDKIPRENKSWKDYCKEKFNAYGVNFEFPWFAILPEQMRKKGEKALVALALAVIEEAKL